MMHAISRRDFLRTSTLAVAGLTACQPANQSAFVPGTFYTVDQRNGHWWLIRPDGIPEFSIGMNHIDSTTLRYSHSGNVWEKQFDNSEERWLRESVRPDLLDWGFNCIGWNQEVVIRGESLMDGRILHNHSRAFTFEEYQWADMPYCHLLPFIESHQWEHATRLPDIRGAEFAEWCDYVARRDCARMKNDPKLIGYFYTDCPIWIHSHVPDFKPPIFDPEMLKTEAGKRELFDLATIYYKVTHGAVRRYDTNHLILGDRYEGRSPLAEEVLKAAVPYTDVLCFQNFGLIDEVVESFQKWHEVTGLPVILADASARQRDRNAKESYTVKIEKLREMASCIGWHLCGAYLKNNARKRGVRDEKNQPDTALIEEMRAANRDTEEYVRRVVG